jgi:hypothetical protein
MNLDEVRVLTTVCVFFFLKILSKYYQQAGSQISAATEE